MRKNKIIVFTSILISIIFGVYFIKSPSIQMPILRIALSISSSSFSDLKLDPAKVNTMNEANLIRNLYIRLLEFNNDGELILQAAESYRVEKNMIIFKIKKEIYSSSGDLITAYDFYKSFLRLIILDGNTHGDLKNLICGNNSKIDLNSKCDGLSYDVDNLYIHTKDPKTIPYLLPMFANVDFSVVPIKAINWKSKVLEISNYNNTSGAYFLKTDNANGSDKILLLRNSKSILINSNSPHEIEIISCNQVNALEMFIKNELDFLPAAYPWDNSHLSKINSIKGVSTHQTYPIKLWSLRFTKRGKEKLSSINRLIVGLIFRLNFNKIYKDEIIESSTQIFPKLSEGSLSAEQDNELNDLYKSISELNTQNISFNLGIPYGELNLFKNALINFSNITYTELKQAPWTLPIELQPDCYLTYGDSSFFEDISMISNQFNMESFSISKENSKDWMDRYILTEDKSTRLKMLRDIHFESLKTANIVPIGFSPFTSAIRNGWKMEFSKFYVGNPYWKIQWIN